MSPSLFVTSTSIRSQNLALQQANTELRYVNLMRSGEREDSGIAQLDALQHLSMPTIANILSAIQVCDGTPAC